MAGIGKIKDPAGTMGYVASVSLPSMLGWPTIGSVILGGIAIVVGFKTHLATVPLAFFIVFLQLYFTTTSQTKYKALCS